MISWDWIAEQFTQVTLLSTFARLLLAAVLGGLIGMERGRRRRAAGMRTYMLVCMGAALVMITNQYIAARFPGTDPTRLGAQVISGIGFLGVGTIIVDRQRQVRGLTTAAGLWACACMGLALGIGFYSGAVIAGVFIMGTISILNNIEHQIFAKSRVMEVYAEFESHGDINRFLNMLAGNGIKATQLEIVKPRDHAERGETRAAATLTMRLPKRHLHADVLENLLNADGLLTIEEVR